MSSTRNKYLKFGAAISLIVLDPCLSGLSWRAGKQELLRHHKRTARSMGDEGYKRNLRVAGNVLPGSIKMSGPHADFISRWKRTKAVTLTMRCALSIKALSLRRIHSRTTPMLWPWASISEMAFFTPMSCRQNAPRSMLRSSNSRELRLQHSRRQKDTEVSQLTHQRSSCPH